MSRLTQELCSSVTDCYVTQPGQRLPHDVTQPDFHVQLPVMHEQETYSGPEYSKCAAIGEDLP